MMRNEIGQHGSPLLLPSLKFYFVKHMVQKNLIRFHTIWPLSRLLGHLSLNEFISPAMKIYVFTEPINNETLEDNG